MSQEVIPQLKEQIMKQFQDSIQSEKNSFEKFKQITEENFNQVNLIFEKKQE